MSSGKGVATATPTTVRTVRLPSPDSRQYQQALARIEHERRLLGALFDND